MTLVLTNSLSGDTETFEPVEQGRVRMYVCGLTVSDAPHLGHARLWVQADLLHRWLEYRGYRVDHVENITDVNEKIVARIGEPSLGADESTVAAHFTAAVFSAMRSLGLRRARSYPRVSEHRSQIIELIERLLAAGVAYEVEGSVYFDVTAFDGYGALSGTDPETAAVDQDTETLEHKRHPADFALWKADGITPESIADRRDAGLGPVDEDAVSVWDAPWGPGRPGWHIECSAMAMHHLGETLDIHMGGRDLRFPHHENEIAQSEAATGAPFARYWLHVGLLQRASEKMSSSLGNFQTVESAVDAHGVGPLRMFFLGATYRTDQQYSQAAMDEATAKFTRLRRTYTRLTDACDGLEAYADVEHAILDELTDEMLAGVEQAMDDDLNVRAAIAAYMEFITAITAYLDEHEQYDHAGLVRARSAIQRIGVDVFGLPLEGEGATSELIETLVGLREDYRAAGAYDAADVLRDALAAVDVELEDTDSGTIVHHSTH
jgi:cysteinyl-tRNA synthetase (EC 6.1.1.16)